MSNETVDSVAAKPVYRVVKTSRLYEQIVKQVEESILSGQLKPGDQLPAERDLAQSFGVSRTAVREAVKTLREKGLVEAFSGRGTFVTNGTSHAIRQSLDLMIRINQQEGSAHLAELRLVLEPEIAGLAASRIDGQLLGTMREMLAIMERNLQDREAGRGIDSQRPTQTRRPVACGAGPGAELWSKPHRSSRGGEDTAREGAGRSFLRARHIRHERHFASDPAVARLNDPDQPAGRVRAFGRVATGSRTGNCWLGGFTD